MKNKFQVNYNCISITDHKYVGQQYLYLVQISEKTRSHAITDNIYWIETLFSSSVGRSYWDCQVSVWVFWLYALAVALNTNVAKNRRLVPRLQILISNFDEYQHCCPGFEFKSEVILFKSHDWGASVALFEVYESSRWNPHSSFAYNCILLLWDRAYLPNIFTFKPSVWLYFGEGIY